MTTRPGLAARAFFRETDVPKRLAGVQPVFRKVCDTLDGIHAER